MKLIHHEKSPKPDRQELIANPMVIFLTKTEELRIMPGDTLQAVSSVVQRVLGLDRPQSRRLVALWFALGERRAHGNPPKPWGKRELRVKSKRKYLTVGPRAVSQLRRPGKAPRAD